VSANPKAAPTAAHNLKNHSDRDESRPKTRTQQPKQLCKEFHNELKQIGQCQQSTVGRIVSDGNGLCGAQRCGVN
jgi:hypothetical protein